MNATPMERYGAGQPLRRKEDRRFLTGAGKFIDDVSMPHMAHLFILRSPHAHARIESIECQAAHISDGHSERTLYSPVAWVNLIYQISGKVETP